jgi:flavorubredoxin
VKFVRPTSKNIELKRTPEPAGYDCVLVGGPVWAFTASPVVITYLDEIESLKGKRAAAFVTHSLPFNSFGAAARALDRLTRKLDALGAAVVDGEGLWWMFRPPESRVETAAAALVRRILNLQ